MNEIQLSEWYTKSIYEWTSLIIRICEWMNDWSEWLNEWSKNEWWINDDQWWMTTELWMMNAPAERWRGVDDHLTKNDECSWWKFHNYVHNECSWMTNDDDQWMIKWMISDERTDYEWITNTNDRIQNE